MNAPGEIQRKTIDRRKEHGAAWAAERLGLESVDLQAVSGDASFRRYFRFRAGQRSIVLMDAPPDKEDSAPFVDIAGRIRRAGLLAPEILDFDLPNGFGLLEDFGDTLYRELIDERSAETLFPELFVLLEGMASRVEPHELPNYGERMLRTELDLFTDWYLVIHRKRPLSRSEAAMWDRVCDSLIRSARAQAQVFVHRDFHSCNLLHTAAGPGIIDFQDGVRGPLNYDLVSLLWDRYIAWPRDQLEIWMNQAHELFKPDCDQDSWIRSCDWMGLQRNLKIVGIFARLHYRDDKQGYLEMIPRFYHYLLEVLPLYPELHEFLELLETDACAP